VALLALSLAIVARGVLTWPPTSNLNVCSVHESYYLFIDNAIISISCVCEFVQPEMITCQSQLGIAIEAAGVFINNRILKVKG